MPDGATAESLNVQSVPIGDFVGQLINRARATLDGAPQFRFMMQCRQGNGTALYFESSVGNFVRSENNTLFLEQFGVWSYTVDANAALCLCERVLDWFVDTLWHRVMTGEELGAADGVMLNMWVGHRTRPHHLPLDEAERYYGEAPTHTANGWSAEWEAPDRLIGNDPVYQRRKEAAQALFELVQQDAMERFAGAIHVAFMHAFQRGPKN
jgi:hypothetical protein